MRALVVGGTGFIGRHIVKDLVSKGVRVRVLVRRTGHTDAVGHDGIEFKYGDLLDINGLKRWTKDVDLVFSAFGLLGHWSVPENRYWEVNTKGVKNLLESCRGSNIKQFIHISSAGVLGPLPDGVVADESFPLKPSNIYEKTKCQAEKEIRSYGVKAGIPFTIIRPEFVYGPGDTHVLGLFRAIQSKRFVLLGNGQSLLQPTYIEDLIQGVSRCTDNEKAIGEVFLITGERPSRVEELANIIAEESHVDLPHFRIPLPVAHVTARVMESCAKLVHFDPPLTTTRVKFFTENRVFSCEKAKTKLGYTPQVDLRDGVRRTIRWYRENRYL